MSQFYGPAKTFRNSLMNTQPGDVIVTDSKGTRVVKVDAPKLPTYEAYSNGEGGCGLYSASLDGGGDLALKNVFKR